jgi:hypothetical protein
MEDMTKKPLPPAEEDPVIDGYLASLQHYSPSQGFDDRVMAQVFTPAPRWLQSARTRVRSLVESGRVWWLLGGLSGAYAVSLSLIVTLIALNTAGVGSFISSLLSNVGLPAWRAFLGMAAGITRSAYSVFSTTTVSGQIVLAAAATLTVLFVFNGWMLYRLMQPVQVVRIARNAPL